MPTPTLLLIDDDAAVRATLTRLVEQHGFRVEAVGSGPDALARLSTAVHELVLLDRTLPGMDGLDVLRAIRQRHTPGEMPVIMVTGCGDSAAVVEALDLGANDYLAKPLDVPVAVARIRTQLARRHAERALVESEERYSLVIRAANDGIFDWRFDRNEGHFSPRWRALLGCGAADTPSLDTWFARVHPDDIAGLRANLDEHLRGRTDHFEFEHRLQRQGDSYRWVMARAVAVRNDAGEAVRLTGSISDITEGKVADALTGLPNRVLLMDRLSRLIGHTRRSPAFQVVVMFIDLDKFKLINDSLGHQAGDDLLIQAAGRLDSCVRSTDTVARLNAAVPPSAMHGSTVGRVGGDEFVVVLGGANQAKGAPLVADRLHAAFAAPFYVGGHELFVSLSIGIAISDARTEHPEDLLREADTAMYRAKSRGPAQTEFFKSNMRVEARAQLQTETELHHALERREFELWYQPIVDVSNGRTRALEALLRWRPSVGAGASPADLVALAERTGLIVPVGYWVLEQACADLVRLIAQSGRLADVHIAINLSTRQLVVPGLVNAFEVIVDKAGLPHGHVEFELTESGVMTDPGAAQQTLGELRARGFRLSIDDFGTGHSSLSYVHRLPVHQLKVDRSFLRRERGDRETDVMMKALVGLGAELGLEVIAEGVESDADLARVRASGCTLAQGFYFAPPQRRDDIVRSLDAWEARAGAAVPA